ncbi:glycoside hydrolase family 9 protein [soil metagenome]
MIAFAVILALASVTAERGSDSTYIRVNQLGYMPDAPKVAVVCSLREASLRRFSVIDAHHRVVLAAAAAHAQPFAACADVHRLDFSALRRAGTYTIVANGISSRPFRIGADVYAGAADTLLYYMREQRSGYNPLFRTVVHARDGIVVDDSARHDVFVPVTGGWADASDYLQYVTTSANATFVMLMAYRDHPSAYADHFDARGDSGANHVPDVLDEARHGLEWLIRMFPSDTVMYNQLGDDRDHTYFDLPTSDSSDYGWGKGRERALYPCTGKPQGLFKYTNRSTGYASTAGKYASAFALASTLFARRDAAFADTLARKARAAYALGKRFPGVCQTAPGHAPYFYEEDNWKDDMELGAAELFALTQDASFLKDAVQFAADEPVTPWMGRDTASHYQWYPWHNSGHYEIWRNASASERKNVAEYYRRGLDAVVARAAQNGFRVGIPFIWCSNNLMISFATQAYLYRRMTGDNRYRSFEQSALDWIFGVNPWGVSMVIGLPHDGVFARDPHSVVAKQLGVELTGALLDGPVYASIYRNLKGIALHDADEYAAFNTGFIVYHDDIGDYSTNEPIMDGTANLSYLLAAMSPDRHVGARGRRQVRATH